MPSVHSDGEVARNLRRVRDGDGLEERAQPDLSGPVLDHLHQSHAAHDAGDAVLLDEEGAAVVSVLPEHRCGRRHWENLAARGVVVGQGRCHAEGFGAEEEGLPFLSAGAESRVAQQRRDGSPHGLCRRPLWKLEIHPILKADKIFSCASAEKRQTLLLLRAAVAGVHRRVGGDHDRGVFAPCSRGDGQLHPPAIQDDGGHDPCLGVGGEAEGACLEHDAWDSQLVRQGLEYFVDDGSMHVLLARVAAIQGETCAERALHEGEGDELFCSEGEPEPQLLAVDRGRQAIRNHRVPVEAA